MSNKYHFIKKRIYVPIKVTEEIRSLCSPKCAFYKKGLELSSPLCVLFDKYLTKKHPTFTESVYRCQPCLREFGKGN